MKKPEPRKKTFIWVGGSRFEETPGGLLFSPEGNPCRKKHPCPDCFFCQGCSDSRCALCRRDPAGPEPEVPGIGPKKPQG